MKIMQILGHNCNWNLDSHLEQNVGDCFLIPAYTHGINYKSNKHVSKVLDSCMIDLQFYGHKESEALEKGHLKEFSFHPAHASSDDVTNVYVDNCIKQSISYQIKEGFKNIIIPNRYDNNCVRDIISSIKGTNKFVKKMEHKHNCKFFMTLAFPYDIIIDTEKVEEILFHCTDMEIVFDGFFVVNETQLGFGEKVNKNLKIIKNVSRILKTLKLQDFETIYGYANWDVILYLAQTDIDYITIGTYENLRKFDIKRFTQNESGGKSDGYYFSEKLLNMVRAEHITLLRETSKLDLISNKRNIFSDIILEEGYAWNAHKPDVNKNYLLSIDSLLKTITNISDIDTRLNYVIELIDSAMATYEELERNHVVLIRESSNYHLSNWKAFLGNVKL